MLRVSSLLTLASVTLLAAWLVTLRPGFLGGPAGYILVKGASMQPAYHTGDLVVTRRQRGYSTGDIVAFHVPKGEPGEGNVVIHRIVGGNGEQGFATEGDNKKSPDPWYPKSEDIIGKAWIHLPGWGRWVIWLRQPLNLAILIGGLTVFSLLSVQQVKQQRRRGADMGGHAQPGSSDTHGRPRLPAPWWGICLLGFFGLLALGLTVYSVVAFRKPAEKLVYVERLHYQHQAAFDYTVQTAPSTLYPDGVIGPVMPVVGADGAPGKAAPPPIYTKLAKRLDLGFLYAMVGSPRPQVSGEISAQLQIKAADNGWTKTQQMLPPTHFDGSAGCPACPVYATTRLNIDLPAMQSVIDTIEKETGVTGSSYDLIVVSTVHVRGQVGAQQVDETYSPAFTIKYSKTQITPDSDLSRTQPKRVGETVRQPQRMSVAGWSLPVMTARWAGAVSAAVAVALGASMAAVVFLGLGQDEAAKVRARYGTQLVSVREANHDESNVVRVATIHDLARLAARDGRIIFRHALPDGDVYFVPDGAVTYEYKPARPQDA